MSTDQAVWPRLVLATANPHKLIELTRILAADHSGLCCDALNGMPGVLSARWSGRHGADAENLRLLLAQLSEVPDERRGAHFSCVAALVLPSGKETLSEGTLVGRLIREA